MKRAHVLFRADNYPITSDNITLEIADFGDAYLMIYRLPVATIAGADDD